MTEATMAPFAVVTPPPGNLKIPGRCNWWARS